MPKKRARLLTDFVNTHLPAAQALHIEVADYDGITLTLKAPLARNHNDKQTAFGGSLYMVAVMAGWGMVYLRCREAGIDPDIVVARGEIDYHAPVDTDIVVSSLPVDEAKWTQFLHNFAERGKAKIEVHTQVLKQDRPALKFTGLYAIVGEKP